jgi:glycerol-3-phosphate acyltransferase PlsY
MSFLIGYFAASFPSGVIIGKVFFKKDIRLLGSGGTGLTNVLRNFGKNAAIAVFILDLLKSTMPVLLAASIAFQWTSVGVDTPFFGQLMLSLAGLGTTLGHCYPIFAQFKGGNDVDFGFQSYDYFLDN